MPSPSEIKRDKTALVLAGGGLTGAVYEIGALRAIQDLLVDRTVNDFDIFVGTSAGALVAAMLANGISPEAMLETVAGDHPDLPPLTSQVLFSYDVRDAARLFARLPRISARALSHYLRHHDDMNLFDILHSLSETLPPGLYDNSSLEKYVREVLGKFVCCNDFRELDRDLNIIATDLDTGERALFSRHDHGHTPISQAVAASTALPVLYKPYRIGGKDYIDGGMRGTASLDIAIEHGARLIVCINPLVPFDNSEHKNIPFLGPDGGYLKEKGFTAVANQVARINMHAGLRYHIKQLRRSHPKVDIILIEPRADDYQMFFYNIMRYSARMIVARHGFETVTVQMAERHARISEILERHGIEVNRALVDRELAEIRDSNYDPDAIRRVLEARENGDRGRPNRTMRRLRRALNELDRALEALAAGEAL